MAITFTATLALFVVLALFIAIPVFIGVYVYKDARRRRMNAALWVLVTVLAPAFIGLIIYLLARGSYPDLSCPACAAPVTEQFTVCPQCGARLKRACPGCGMPAEDAWQVCPSCAHPLPGAEECGVTPPLKHKDKGLRRILVAVLLIPLAFMLLFAFFGLNAYGGKSSSMSSGYYTPQDYADNPQVTQWLADCDPTLDGLYVLRWKTSAGESVKTSYLIYDPSADANRDTSLKLDGRFGKTLVLRMTTSEIQTEPVYTLTAVIYTADHPVGLKVFVDGEEKDCIFTDVPFDPSLLE